MPPQRDVLGHLDIINVEEHKVPNVPEVKPQRKVTNVEFRDAIGLLSQIVSNKVGQLRRPRQEVTDTPRIREFFRMNPLSFSGSRTIEDLGNFINELNIVFHVMHSSDIERVELVVYQLENITRTWFD